MRFESFWSCLAHGTVMAEFLFMEYSNFLLFMCAYSHLYKHFKFSKNLNKRRYASKNFLSMEKMTEQLGSFSFKKPQLPGIDCGFYFVKITSTQHNIIYKIIVL